eukprot:gene45248-20243_t
MGAEGSKKATGREGEPLLDPATVAVKVDPTRAGAAGKGGTRAHCGFPRAGEVKFATYGAMKMVHGEQVPFVTSMLNLLTTSFIFGQRGPQAPPAGELSEAVREIALRIIFVCGSGAGTRT